MLGRMMRNGTADKLTALMSGAAATTNPTYTATFVESGQNIEKTGPLNGTTAVDIIPTPEGTSRMIESVRIHNADTAAVTVTLQRIIGSVTSQVMKITLQSLDTLIWEGDAARVVDQNGNTKSVSATTITGVVASADGAISARSGVVVVTKATAAALTLANPTAGTDDYKELTVISATAAAHTVDNSAGAGFNAGGAASDVGTFGGAKGDNIRVVAYQGVWYVQSKVNVTLG